MTKARAPRIGGKQWTAAGAARFARDARAQTVLHLAKAQTPVQWQVYGLTAGLDMWQRMYGDRRLATEVLLGPIGYPPPHTGTVTDYAQQLTRDTAAATAAASLFVVSPTMHDVVVAAALTLSINDLMHVDETDPPTPAGLVVLPHAMLQVDAARDTADVRALLWSPITAYGPDGEQGPGLRVTAFLDAHGPVRVATFDAFAEQARLRGEPLPPLVFDASQGLPFHYNKPVGPLVLAERALHVREQAERGRRAAEDTGHDASATVGEYTSGAPVDDTDESLSRRYLFAFWRLCEQHIAEITQAPLTHSAAATAAPRRHQPAGQRRHPPTTGPRRRPTRHTQPVQWSTRWVVRMHKVDQWYPKLNTHRVLWRGPYVKGPDGLPVKQPTVSALVR